MDRDRTVACDCPIAQVGEEISLRLTGRRARLLWFVSKQGNVAHHIAAVARTGEGVEWTYRRPTLCRCGQELPESLGAGLPMVDWGGRAMTHPARLPGAVVFAMAARAGLSTCGGAEAVSTCRPQVGSDG